MEEKNKEVEIDLLELAHKLWDNKKFITKATLIGMVVGLIIAFSIPKEYTSTVIFTTNSNDTKVSNMGALASLAGINLNNNAPDMFSPELYPYITNSTSFIQKLLSIRVKDKTQNIDTTLYSYLKDGQKKAWWSYVLTSPNLLLSFFKNEQDGEDDEVVSPYFISEEEMEIIEGLKKSHAINTDKKTGITTFEVKSQSPIVSAFLTDTITAYLQSYIIQERTKKAQADLENSRKLYELYKEEYNRLQKKLASFIDKNKNIISESYRFNQRKLELEANLAYDVYNQMAKQVQMNEIKVQDETPVFTIIQPAIEPIYPSSPNKKMILAITLLLFFSGGCGWILKKDLWNLFMQK